MEALAQFLVGGGPAAIAGLGRRVPFDSLVDRLIGLLFESVLVLGDVNQLHQAGDVVVVSLHIQGERR